MWVLRVMLMVIVMVTALPHCPSVAIRKVLLSIVVAMVTTLAVTLLFELAVAPLLSVVVLLAEAAAGLGGVELVLLRGCFLKVGRAQVLLGVVVSMEGLLFP